MSFELNAFTILIVRSYISVKSIEELVVDLQENFTDEQFEVLAQRLQGVIVKKFSNL